MVSRQRRRAAARIPPLKYDALPDSSSIRLLKIVDVTGPIVRCTLETFSPPSIPSYAALSYTWGQASPTDKMTSDRTSLAICNRKQVLITKNLEHALRALARPTPQHMWIDAICLNQDDHDERSAQVARMANIYANASSVVVWLGPADRSAANAFQLIEDLSHRIINVKANAGKAANDNSWLNLHYHSLRLWKLLGRREFSHRDAMDLAALFCRNWFERAWVIQEVALAKQVLVRCGHLALSWFSLELVACWMRSSGFAKEYQGVHDRLRRHVDAPGHSIAASPLEISKLREGFRDPSYSGLTPVIKGMDQETATINLYRALYRFTGTFRFYQATDQRDKIIAPLSLALHWAGDVLPNDDHDIRSLLDYTKSPSQIYERASEMLIQHTGELSILLMVEDTSVRNHPDLPSWVPDFSVSMMPIICEISQRPVVSAVPTVAKVGGSVLSCAGRRVSEVTLVGPGRADIRSSWIPLLKFLSSIGPSCGSFNGSEVSSADEFISVAFGGRFDGECVSQTNRHSALFSFLLFAVARSPEFNAMIDDYQKRLQLESPGLALKELAVALRSQSDSSPPTLEVLDILAQRFPEAVPTLAFATSWFSSRDGAVQSDLLPPDQAKCGRCIEDSEVLSTLSAHHPVTPDAGYTQSVVLTPPDDGITQAEPHAPGGDALHSAMKAGFEAGFTTHFIKQQAHHEAAFHSRRLFRAASGFIGLTPESSQEDDEIWMLLGCPAPVILRRNADGTSHRLVGAAFVNLLEEFEMQWQSQGAPEEVRIV